MKIRSGIAALLRAGHNNAEIARRIGCDISTVRRARRALGLPAAPSGTRRIPLADRFHRYTRPVGDGHLEWTGYRNPTTGLPQIRDEDGRLRTAATVAFRLQYGRTPVGNVKAGCDLPGCVAPSHVEDRPLRIKTRTMYAAIFGVAS